uniref:Uncharacterized protein n=1 Tax=Soybean thrips virga-like virus 1 TaxID=2802949 RepID=A0A7T8G263_9VIRU|nr:hypothetical protein 1 [Soybean thrips virga-like virus 1]
MDIIIHLYQNIYAQSHCHNCAMNCVIDYLGIRFRVKYGYYRCDNGFVCCLYSDITNSLYDLHIVKRRSHELSLVSCLEHLIYFEIHNDIPRDFIKIFSWFSCDHEKFYDYRSLLSCIDKFDLLTFNRTAN